MRVLMLCAISLLIGLNARSAQEAPGKKEVHIHLSPGRAKPDADAKVTPAKLITRVNPTYPPLARQARISGTVELKVVITQQGDVTQIDLISGHPLLVQSAIDAVRQWKYDPTRLNDEPVEVDTTIEVIFVLNTGDTGRGLASSPKAIDSQLRADLIKLFELRRAPEIAAESAKQAIELKRPAMFPKITEEDQRKRIIDSFEQKVTTIFQSEAFRETVITAYSKYFNNDDAKVLIAFYDSPTGRKFNDATPHLLIEMTEQGQRLAKERLPEIMKELCKENLDLAGKLPNCGPPDPDKKNQPSESAPPSGAPTNQ